MGAVVVEVIDGDTFVAEVGGVEERVRIGGINAPEIGECFYQEATDLLVELVRGEQVILRATGEQRDQFGRLLRRVSVDGVDVGRTMAIRGAAINVSFGPDSQQQREITEAEAAAIASGTGLWAPAACGPAADANLSVDRLEFDPPGDDLAPGGGEWIRIRNSGAPVDLTGWSLRDASSSNRYSFPVGHVLPPQASVSVFSSCGSNGPNRLYWCRNSAAIWNNSGDTAFLVDPSGNIHDHMTYRP